MFAIPLDKKIVIFYFLQNIFVKSIAIALNQSYIKFEAKKKECKFGRNKT